MTRERPDEDAAGQARPRISRERRGHVLLIGLDRPEKRNAADLRLLQELCLAYAELEHDPELRVGVVHAHGEHFTGGLDLADIGPAVGPEGLPYLPEGGIDPWRLQGAGATKPIVMAVQGLCYTLGIELILAADIAVAAASTVFAQLEVSRGLLPFGGATLRFPARTGWGDAMRWILTGERFDAAEALRIGLIQELAPDGEQLERALAIAERIAAQAPLAVQATLASARLAIAEGPTAAAARLQQELVRLLGTEDARIGMAAFLARSEPEYRGR